MLPLLNRACWSALLTLALTGAYAQPFTRADSLRGSLRPERTSYDVTFYDLSLSVDPASRTIAGQNTIRYKVVAPFRRMQLDLFANMTISAITQSGKKLAFIREGNAVFVTMNDPQTVGQLQTLTVAYAGSPIVAKNAPWDGGFVWKKDSLTGRDWVTVACEGKGASLWWPCKDHLSDEPDSMRITCRVPAGLTCVSNGAFVSEKPVNSGQQTEWTWFVHYPINNYNVTLNITDYAHFSDIYTSPDHTKLPLDYYVLPGNLAKAKVHFEQAKGMLACYERYFGKYPFGRDGYKLVETPYWGMEHQSAVAYGNEYRNNPYGFDFIIIHESGHEYFGNSLSVADHAEMWIHESFTTYAEALYLACTQGEQTAQAYLNRQRTLIKNQYPMIGPIGVNFDQKDTDIYYKGTWMLHTLRHAVANDSVWFAALKALATEKRLSIVSTGEVVDFLAKRTGMPLQPVMNQYLYHAALPLLEYTPLNDNAVRYRWKAAVADFNLPVQVRLGSGVWQTIRPTSDWQTTTLPAGSGAINVNTEIGLFLVKTVALDEKK